jgi:hypothetical protein
MLVRGWEILVLGRAQEQALGQALVQEQVQVRVQVPVQEQVQARVLAREEEQAAHLEMKRLKLDLKYLRMVVQNYSLYFGQEMRTVAFSVGGKPQFLPAVVCSVILHGTPDLILVGHRTPRQGKSARLDSGKV